jgi:hypothetical protein
MVSMTVDQILRAAAAKPEPDAVERASVRCESFKKAVWSVWSQA